MKKRFVFLVAAALLVFAAPSFFRPFYRVPVLMYHHVGFAEPGEESLYVTPRTFEKQMEFLKAHHYRVLPLENVVAKIRSGERIPMNTVAITFDDGFLDNFKNAYPVLKKMDFPATIFMITNNIGQEHWLSEEDLRILDSSGVAIGSHTLSHAFLPGIPAEAARKEIVESKAALETILGHPVVLFSYPAGGTTAEIEQSVRDAGYEGAVTTNYRAAAGDPYGIRRVKIKDANGNLFNFWIKTTGFYHLGKKMAEAKAGE